MTNPDVTEYLVLVDNSVFMGATSDNLIKVVTMAIRECRFDKIEIVKVRDD